MYDNDDRQGGLLIGLINALLLEAFSVVVLIGLFRVINLLITNYLK